VIIEYAWLLKNSFTRNSQKIKSRHYALQTTLFYPPDFDCFEEIEFFNTGRSLRIGIGLNEFLDFPTSADVGGKEGHQCLQVFFDLILTVRQVDSPKVATRLQTFDTGL